MWKIIEPNRWIEVVKSLNNWMNSSQNLIYLMPKLADVFIFSYPIYLFLLYLAWWVSKKIEYKKSALFIFTSVFSTAVVNLIIQYFVVKSRPNLVLWLTDLKTETILHKFLPSSSFPSDHAWVSMSVAVASIIRWIMHKDRKYIRFWFVLVLFSFVMSFARVTTAVHWPTDIIAGMLVGIMVPIILSRGNIYIFLDRVFSWIWVKI